MPSGSVTSRPATTVRPIGVGVTVNAGVTKNPLIASASGVGSALPSGNSITVTPGNVGRAVGSSAIVSSAGVAGSGGSPSARGEPRKTTKAATPQITSSRGTALRSRRVKFIAAPIYSDSIPGRRYPMADLPPLHQCHLPLRLLAAFRYHEVDDPAR